MKIIAIGVLVIFLLCGCASKPANKSAPTAEEIKNFNGSPMPQSAAQKMRAAQNKKPSSNAGEKKPTAAQ